MELRPVNDAHIHHVAEDLNDFLRATLDVIEGRIKPGSAAQ